MHPLPLTAPDHDLALITEELTADQRLEMAQIFRRWARLLIHKDGICPTLRGTLARMKKVPQTDTNQTEFNFNAVRLEPELQIQAATLDPRQRVELAIVYRRYAHQLEISARVLERQRVPWRRRQVPKLESSRLRWN